MPATVTDACPPGPPGLMNKDPIFLDEFEDLAGSLTSPRLKCSPEGSSQSIGTEKLAQSRLSGTFASAGHGAHSIDDAVLFSGGKAVELRGTTVGWLMVNPMRVASMGNMAPCTRLL